MSRRYQRYKFEEIAPSEATSFDEAASYGESASSGEAKSSSVAACIVRMPHLVWQLQFMKQPHLPNTVTLPCLIWLPHLVKLPILGGCLNL